MAVLTGRVPISWSDFIRQNEARIQQACIAENAKSLARGESIRSVDEVAHMLFKNDLKEDLKLEESLRSFRRSKIILLQKIHAERAVESDFEQFVKTIYEYTIELRASLILKGVGTVYNRLRVEQLANVDKTVFVPTTASVENQENIPTQRNSSGIGSSMSSMTVVPQMPEQLSSSPHDVFCFCTSCTGAFPARGKF